MKKNRIIALLLVAFVVPMCLSAAFLQFGPSYTIDFPIEPENEKVVDFEALDFSSYHVGADTRMNIGYVQLQGTVKALVTEDLRIGSFDLGASVGLRSHLSFLEFVAGVGAKSDIVSDSGKWLVNGGDWKGFKEMGMSSSFFYKASLGINFGKKVCLSLESVVPVDLTIGGLFEDQPRSIAEAFTPQLDKTTVSVGILLKLV